MALPYPEHGPEFSDPDALAGLAQGIETAGLDAVWLTDHPFPKVGPGRPGHRSLDPFSTGGYLAAATERLIIHLNIVVMSFRNPFILAQSLATLDRLSKGRLIAGIGAGYIEEEFAALGATFSRRVEAIDEGLTAMKAAWLGEPVFLEGSTWRATGNQMAPTPFRSPHPVLWRGGNSRRAIRSAVEQCDGWSPFESTRERARDTGTTSLGGPGALAAGIALLRRTEAALERAEPLQVCFVRGYHSYSAGRLATGWLDSGDDAVRDDVGRFEELGVDWLAFALPGATPTEIAENAQRFATAVGRSRVLPSATASAPLGEEVAHEPD